MKQVKTYLLIILPILAGIGFILWAGVQCDPVFNREMHSSGYSISTLIHKILHEPLPTVLVQLILILMAAKGLGWLFTRFGQQSVMGEITAGILLGPSFFGWLMPDAFHSLFPGPSLVYLGILSQLGLLLFMFVIGMELDIDVLRQRLGESLVISHTSIVFPFLLGTGFAYFTYSQFGTTGHTFIEYALFMGIAMSITAFPVLARILKERNMTTTPIGSMALICAAVNDVTAWCILPIVVAISKAESMTGVFVTIGFTIAFVLIMVTVVKSLLQKYFGDANSTSGIAFISVAMIVLLLSALLAEVIGIHALFGAFIAGAVMPNKKEMRQHLTEQFEGVSLSLLLPVFFVLTGLRTNIGSISGSLWIILLIIVSLAVTGKFFGSAIAARFTGMTWKDSLRIGALMNTRGLIELIVLNIGYDLGVLRQEVFTMLVFMALVTTFMTAPLLNAIDNYDTQ